MGACAAVLIAWRLPSCSPSDAVKEATEPCDTQGCDFGQNKVLLSEASGSCDADGTYRPATDEVAVGGSCNGAGRCEFVCTYDDELIRQLCNCSGVHKITRDGLECQACGAGEPGSEQGDGDSGPAGDDGAPSTGGTEGTDPDPSADDGGVELPPLDPADCDEAGDDLDVAYDFGVLGAEVVNCSGFAESDGDYFRLELEENATVTLTLETTTGRLGGGLYADAEQINKADPLVPWDVRQTQLTLDLKLERGVYFAAVVPVGASTIFDIDVSADAYPLPEVEPEAGNSFDDATSLGTIGSSRIDVGGYVGATDAEDIYAVRFESNGTFTYTVADVEGRVQVALYEDADQINIASPIRTVDVSATDQLVEIELGQGDYLLRVVPVGSSLYSLSLSFE